METLKITINEINSQEVPNFTVQGESLFIYDLELDFSTIANGEDILPDQTITKYILGGNRDANGVLTIRLLFPYNAKTYQQGKDIASEIEVIDGVVNPYIDKVV